MNKLLLGTTALVGASILMAGAAYAAAPKVTVGGGFKFEIGGANQDVDRPDRGYDFRTDSEIAVKASGKTDAGMGWSAKVEIEADAGTTEVDELVIGYSGSWGKLQLGNEDGAEDLMQHGLNGYASAGDGLVDGHWVKFVQWGVHDGPKMAADTSDATKITYFTPRVNGVQAGVSFTPDRGANGQDLSTDLEPATAGDSGDLENSWGIGVNFVDKVGGFDVAVSAVGYFGNDEDDGSEDTAAYGFGAEVGYGAWSVGGGYANSGDGGKPTANTLDQDDWNWHVGGAYSQGPLTIGVAYLHVEEEDGSAGGADEGDVIVGGVNYSLGGGARVFAEVFWFDEDDQAGADVNEGVGFVLGTAVKF